MAHADTLLPAGAALPQQGFKQHGTVVVPHLEAELGGGERRADSAGVPLGRRVCEE